MILSFREIVVRRDNARLGRGLKGIILALKLHLYPTIVAHLDHARLIRGREHGMRARQLFHDPFDR